MKTKLMTILLTASVILATMALPSLGVEEDTSDIWQDEKPRRGRQLTEERIELIMKRIAEADPEKAAQLEKLRKEDPETFKAQLREAMRERYGRRGREGTGGEHDGPPKGMRGKGEYGRGPGPGKRGEGEHRFGGRGGPGKRGEGEHRFGPRGGGRGEGRGGPGGPKPRKLRSCVKVNLICMRKDAEWL
ncbi:MAG: hypothetical protein ACYSWP_09355 [Planctomycetota bacterium]